MALGRCSQESLVGVLSVEVYETTGHLGQSGRRFQAPIDIRPTASIGGHHPTKHKLAIERVTINTGDDVALINQEATLHDSLNGPGADDRRVGPAT